MQVVHDWKHRVITVIEVNKLHISPLDWTRVSPNFPYGKTAWVEVPKEDVDYLGELVKEGASFAYASLLQSCDRNDIKWIHISDEYPLIKGLKVFDKEWAEYSATG
ncbi:MAG: hypothetical protein CMF19_04530 [Idiomarinaceae bacterium]|nr:hypothetical protein [Idiomarinaceae bacterium]